MVADVIIPICPFSTQFCLPARKPEMSAIASFSAKEFLAMLATASEEERVAIAALLPIVPAPKKAATTKVAPAASEERPPADLSSRPDMPPPVELDDDFCHARIGVKLAKEDIVDADKDDWLGRESGLKFGGFRSKIFLESQCTNKPSKGEIVCSGCAKKFAKHKEEKDQEKWTAWNGLIGEAPPKKNRYIGSDYSTASYEAWGEAPRSGPSSAKKSSAGEPAAKKEVKKAEPKAKTEVKKAEPKKEAKPSNAAAAASVAPPPAAAPKKPVISIPDDLVENAELSCFINSEGICYYADFDEDTLESIPDMSRIVGSIPKGVDREAATKADFTEAEETEEPEE